MKQQISALTDELHSDVTSKEQSDLLAKQFVNLETKWKDDADKIVKLSVCKYYCYYYI